LEAEPENCATTVADTLKESLKTLVFMVDVVPEDNSLLY